jgi:hypothetical protein
MHLCSLYRCEQILLKKDWVWLRRWRSNPEPLTYTKSRLSGSHARLFGDKSIAHLQLRPFFVTGNSARKQVFGRQEFFFAASASRSSQTEGLHILITNLRWLAFRLLVQWRMRNCKGFYW